MVTRPIASAPYRRRCAIISTAGYSSQRGSGFVLVERATPYEKAPRKGLMIAVDLERYQYGKDLALPSSAPPRAPSSSASRRACRSAEGAALELPHIMLLVDDPERSIIEPLYAARERLPKLYDFELMLGSGRVRGWQVKDEAALSKIAGALETLADPAAFKAKYGKDDVLLFAVGDGQPFPSPRPRRSGRRRRRPFPRATRASRPTPRASR